MVHTIRSEIQRNQVCSERGGRQNLPYMFYNMLLKINMRKMHISTGYDVARLELCYIE